MARNTVKVRAPLGTSEASVGTHLLPADLNGDIDATDDDAAALLGIPGFTAAAIVEVPAGYAAVVAPEGCGALSYGGVTFTVGADSTVIVPAGAVADLLSHGFTPADVVDGVDIAPPAPRAPAAPPVEAVAPVEPPKEA